MNLYEIRERNRRASEYLQRKEEQRNERLNQRLIVALILATFLLIVLKGR